MKKYSQLTTKTEPLTNENNSTGEKLPDPEWINLTGEEYEKLFSQVEYKICEEWGGSLNAFIDGKIQNVAEHLNELERNK